MQDDDRPFVRRQNVEQRSDLVPIEYSLERVLAGDLVGAFQGDEPHDPTSPHPIATIVDEYLVEPCTKVGWLPHAVQVSPRPFERIANGVLSFPSIRQK